ncbi:unnamed protein product [Medioppia subpectinata]|uniref:Uncharacterized protein n=1 Tax=Medioppia subpectinata TaxID=1979941 RepID=A0A7R9QI52_9ACAR|nr:unnamed protein product [Medioppia subpectinata]CAG2121065.1 unnamed protein product [Medioppia subpectinata]
MSYLISLSSNLANDHIEGIKEMITEEAYEEVVKNYSDYSLQQKSLLKVNTEDILFCYPYNIQIMKQSPDSVTVKIFVVFDCVSGINDLIQNHMSNQNFKFMSFNKYMQNKICLNYQFIRHYMKDNQSDWIVDKLLHMKDKDILKMYRLFRK